MDISFFQIREFCVGHLGVLVCHAALGFSFKPNINLIMLITIVGSVLCIKTHHFESNSSPPQQYETCSLGTLGNSSPLIGALQMHYVVCF